MSDHVYACVPACMTTSQALGPKAHCEVVLRSPRSRTTYNEPRKTSAYEVTWPATAPGLRTSTTSTASVESRTSLGAFSSRPPSHIADSPFICVTCSDADIEQRSLHIELSPVIPYMPGVFVRNHIVKPSEPVVVGAGAYPIPPAKVLELAHNLQRVATNFTAS